jgi:hypothetical protein
MPKEEESAPKTAKKRDKAVGSAVQCGSGGRLDVHPLTCFKIDKFIWPILRVFYPLKSIPSCGYIISFSVIKNRSP